jgi:hypothetical protein
MHTYDGNISFIQSRQYLIMTFILTIVNISIILSESNALNNITGRYLNYLT